MTTLTEFLTARYDEDRQWALDQIASGVSPYGETSPAHPRRMLAEVEAKRRIVELHEPKVITWPKAHGMDPYIERLCTGCGTGMRSWGPGDPAEFEPVDWPCPTLRALTLPYADHPDYDEAWRP